MRRPPIDLAIAASLLVMSGLAKLPTLGQPLLEAHLFRQTQTAYTALLFHEEGIDLMRPQIPVFGPPWVVPFEFPLFQAAGALLMDVGIEPDVAMRSVGLSTFLLTGVLLFGLLRRVAGRTAALIALAAFLFSPFGLLWGRTSLMEYLATAGGLGFLWAGITWLDNGHRGAYVSALLAGSIAVLTKATTGGFYLIPLLVYRGMWKRTPSRWIANGALVAVPVLVGLAWTVYADRFKLAHPTTAWLTSTSPDVRQWFFGEISDRWDLVRWAPIAKTLFFTMTGLLLPLWLVTTIARLRRLPGRWFLAALLVAVGLLPVIVLLPLYFVHDYYLVAISPVIAAMIGLGGSWLWIHRRSRAARTTGAVAATVWLCALAITTGYWATTYVATVDREGTLQAADYIRARTEPDDWVVLRGRGWDPSTFYYARRRGFMIRPYTDEQAVIDLLMRDTRYTLFVDCPYSEPCRPMRAEE